MTSGWEYKRFSGDCLAYVKKYFRNIIFQKFEIQRLIVNHVSGHVKGIYFLFVVFVGGKMLHIIFSTAVPQVATGTAILPVSYPVLTIHPCIEFI